MTLILPMARGAVFLTIAMACRADSDTCNFNDGAMNYFWPLEGGKF